MLHFAVVTYGNYILSVRAARTCCITAKSDVWLNVHRNSV